jgi:hypothetical protein
MYTLLASKLLAQNLENTGRITKMFLLHNAWYVSFLGKLFSTLTPLFDAPPSHHPSENIYSNISYKL